MFTAWVSAVGVSLVAAAEPPKVEQRWAVLIGVDDYAYAQKLNYCGADQLALRDQLVASGFPDDQVFLLHDKADDTRMRPSQGNIERQLNLVLSLADERDLVVVAFSGHGVHLGGKSFLCPGDCTLDDAKTLIAVDSVYERLQECAADFKLVLIDACRNDPRPGGARSLTATDGTRALARTLQELKLPQGVVLLNSCAPGEISWEDENFKHGVFMHYVLDGLQGAADASGDGNVSLNELQNYAGQRTKIHVARKFSVAQRPFFKGDLSTEALEYALLPVPVATAKEVVPAYPTTPDAASTALAVAMAKGDWHFIWHAFPAEYQADLTTAKNEFAAKMDPDTWNTLMLVTGKLSKALRNKKEWIIASPLAANLPQETRDSIARYWDVGLNVVDVLTSSEIKTLDGFKQADIGRFLQLNAPRVVPEIMNAIAEVDPNIKAAPGITHSVVSQQGDSAVLRVHEPGKEPTELEVVRVGGKWVPKQMADEWKTTIANLRDGIAKLTIPAEQKAKALDVLGRLNLSVDRLNTAKDQATFNSEVMIFFITLAPLLPNQQPQSAPTN
jgi:hypothetical protein